MPFTKLHRRLVTSSVWNEPDHVRILWVTMLALADKDGVVDGSVPGLAVIARLSLERCQDALRVLSWPDEHSRTKSEWGCRIREVEGGWQIVNYDDHRELDSIEQIKKKDAERQRRHRAKKAGIKRALSESEKKSETKAEAEGSVTNHVTSRDSEEWPNETSRVVVVEGESPEFRETVCPLDLRQRLEKNGTVSRLAEQLAVEPARIVACIDGFVATWTIGKLAGHKRSGWAGRARQWVIDQHTKRQLPGSTGQGATATQASPLAEEWRKFRTGENQ